MYKLNLKKQLRGCLYLLSAMVFFATSCVDKDFDLSKDIDLTLGVGTEGLSVKLGTTDKILLKDIIDEDENIKTDDQSKYYMIEEGDFTADFNVESVSSKIDPITFETGDVIDYKYIKGVVEEQSGHQVPSNEIVSVPKGLKANGMGYGNSSFAFDLNDVDKAIVEIAEVYPVSGTQIALNINILQTGDLAFGLDKIDSLKIGFPKFMPINASAIATEYPYSIVGDTLEFKDVENVKLNQPFVTIRIDYFDLLKQGKVENGKIHLDSKLCNVKVIGGFSFTTERKFDMKTTDNVRVSANVGFVDQYSQLNSTVTIDKVKGNFNPEINPNIDPIDIASTLPDFLQDDDVVLDVANPTLKVVADLGENANQAAVPFDLIISGILKAEKSNEIQDSVTIPVTRIVKEKLNTLYFSQMDEPYDPDGLVNDATVQVIDSLSDLLKPSIPDQISIDMSDGKIRVDKDIEYMITLNSSYSPKMNYQIMVPFLFNKGLKIVYKDSTESIGDDLKDLAAKGVKVHTDVHTTIPLTLHVEAEALDANGELIALDGQATADVPACVSNSEDVHAIEVEINLKDPSDLSRIDRVRFIVHANASDNQDSRDLRSDQYLFMKDIRVRLNGPVIVDLN